MTVKGLPRGCSWQDLKVGVTPLVIPLVIPLEKRLRSVRKRRKEDTLYALVRVDRSKRICLKVHFAVAQCADTQANARGFQCMCAVACCLGSC